MTTLTQRTIERAHTVARLARAGYTLDTIAHQLGLSTRTAERLHTTSKTLPGEAAMPTTDWARRGLCRNYEPENFFPLSYHNGKPDVRAAKSICRACPVQPECLNFALTHPDQTADGIWGGLTPPERARARRTRQQTEGTAAA